MRSFYDRRSVRTMEPLSNDQILRYAPSVFATAPWHGVSEAYRFIPTIEVVENMRREGFLPVAATLWEGVSTGKITADEARQRALKFAGGFDRPVAGPILPAS